MLLLAWTKVLVKALVLPPTGPLLLVLLGLSLLIRFPRVGRLLAFVGAIGLLVLSMPVTSSFMIRHLDRPSAFDDRVPTNAQAIVILGGGTREHAPEYGGASLGILSLERVRYGARIAKSVGLPVLVSGGPTKRTPPEATLMRDVLVNEFNVPVRWVEVRSRNTHENAVESAAILKRDGIDHVILVVHSFDVARATAEFESNGIRVIAAPTQIPPSSPIDDSAFLPTSAGLQTSYYALYELLANMLYFITR